MEEKDVHRLYRIVLDALGKDPSEHDRQRIRLRIAEAHHGMTSGDLVTTENIGLFRQYRNSVSPDPKHLVAAALAFAKETEETCTESDRTRT